MERLTKGNTVVLLEKPDGYESRHYPLTVGRRYIVVGWMGSCIEITCDTPDRIVSIYHGRVKTVV